jgi:hypothetical protein
MALDPKQANIDAFDAHEKHTKSTISVGAAFPFAASA